MDRLDAMRLFLRVADTGSFSKAAADLEIGQPTVSRRIQDLEAQLGADLFLRTTRALSLTEAGQSFYARARGIREIWGAVLRENRRMLALCDELGFRRQPHPEETSALRVVLTL